MKKIKKNLLGFYSEKGKILLIGKRPPPFGGVSVHVQRLEHFLRKAGREASLFDFISDGLFGKITYLKLVLFLILNQFDDVHIHLPNHKILKIILWLRKYKKYNVLVTLHNPRIKDLISSKNGRLFLKALKKIDKLIVVGEVILNALKEDSVRPPKKVVICDSFIPPTIENEKAIISTYSEETAVFYNSRNPLLVANAFQLVFQNGIDLYGLDLCIQMTFLLKKHFADIGFIFALANGNDHIEYIKKMNELIIERKISDNFHFMTGQKEIWPLFKKSHLMVRPTFSDGFGISVAEALFFNCPVVASDVCRRPKDTILFKNRDINSLYEKSLHVLKKPSQP
ncbi:glycosyltransferase [Fibrobacterota bacterium]